MSGNQFDEKWLKEYLERTGCKAYQTGGIVQLPTLPFQESPEPQVLSPGRVTESGKFANEVAQAFNGDNAGGKRPNKYGNEPVDVDGERFDSRHEARVYERLRLEGLAGAHVGLARQVTFLLPGGVKYVADFVLLNRDGSYRVLDAKSTATRKNAVYRLKKRQMKACLGLDVEEV